MIKDIEGIIINERNYGENDKIITIFSIDGSLYSVKVVAGRKLKNVNRGKTQIFNVGTFTINEKNDKFSTLRNAVVTSNYMNMKFDTTKYYNGIYLCELILKLGYYGDVDPYVYQQFLLAFDRFETQTSYAETRVTFELMILKYFGVKPHFDNCVVCSNSKVVTASHELGGFVCGNCVNTYDKTYSIKTLMLLKKLCEVDFNTVGKIEISDEIIKEIDHFLVNYIDYHLHIKMKSKEFI